MTEQIANLSHAGNWTELLPILRSNPRLVNGASEPKGYTALHQAAWHGAPLAIVGELLALGADRRLRTHSKQQTAYDIAVEKHNEREDLKYFLTLKGRSISQLIRKAVADNPTIFGNYDGNQVVCDRLIECFGTDTLCDPKEDLRAAMHAAFFAVTGASLSSLDAIAVTPINSIDMYASPRFWNDTFFPILGELVTRAHLVPIEKEWAVVSDLFDPPPLQFGLRGDLFLWLEMRQVLCHVAIPETAEDLAMILSSAFVALTGKRPDDARDFAVPRFARGGMSGGYISRQFWTEVFIPMMQQRLGWFLESWSHKKSSPR